MVQIPPVLRIATRGSPLALTQTSYVADLLRAHVTGVEIEVVRIATRGDVITDRPIASIADGALFVAAIEEALRDGRADLAVHSAKDLPADLPPDMAIAAIPTRADPRDAIVSRFGGLSSLPAGARVGTSSVRRSSQILARRPDLRILDIRGNVDTRLAKLEAGDFDAVVLAMAGLERLGRIDDRVHSLSIEEIVPAPAQGALAVEVRASDTALIEALARIDDPQASVPVYAERAFLRAAGGGCSTAVAAHVSRVGDAVDVLGFIGAPDGRAIRHRERAPVDRANAAAENVARFLLAAGGEELLRT